MLDEAIRTGSRPSHDRRSSCSGNLPSPRASARCSCLPASAECRRRRGLPRASRAGSTRMPTCPAPSSCARSFPGRSRPSISTPMPSCTSWSTRSSATTTRCRIGCSCTTNVSFASIWRGRCAAIPVRPEPSTSTRSRAAPRRCVTSSSRSKPTGCSTPATRLRW